jgi:hypothetical protein
MLSFLLSLRTLTTLVPMQCTPWPSPRSRARLDAVSTIAGRAGVGGALSSGGRGARTFGRNGTPVSAASGGPVRAAADTPAPLGSPCRRPGCQASSAHEGWAPSNTRQVAPLPRCAPRRVRWVAVLVVRPGGPPQPARGAAFVHPHAPPPGGSEGQGACPMVRLLAAVKSLQGAVGRLQP